jgi:hypothetical protein
VSVEAVLCLTAVVQTLCEALLRSARDHMMTARTSDNDSGNTHRDSDTGGDTDSDTGGGVNYLLPSDLHAAWRGVQPRGESEKRGAMTYGRSFQDTFCPLAAYRSWTRT